MVLQYFYRFVSSCHFVRTRYSTSSTSIPMSKNSEKVSCRKLGLDLCDRCRCKRAGCVRNAELEQAQQALAPARTSRAPSKFADDDTYRTMLRDQSGVRACGYSACGSSRSHAIYITPSCDKKIKYPSAKTHLKPPRIFL